MATRRGAQEEMLLNMDHAREGASFQGASLNVPQEVMLLNMDHAHAGVSLQGAKRHVPQEEMLLNMDPGGGARARANILGFRVFTFDRQCGGVM